MTTKNTKEYSQGKIYKIEPIGDFDEGDIYIGLTTQRLLSQRMGKHRCCYGCWKNGKCNKTSSFELFDKYGIDNCQILLLETVNTSNLDELKSREAYYIRTLKCVNKYTPIRTQAEWYLDTKLKVAEQRQEYYETNKDIIKDRQIEYRKNNKEILAVKRKEYYEANKVAILEKQKQRRLQKDQERQDRLNDIVAVNL